MRCVLGGSWSLVLVVEASSVVRGTMFGFGLEGYLRFLNVSTG